MPQMAPTWWMSLMILTLLLMMIMMTCTYFNVYKNILKKINVKKNELNWKW